VKLLSTEVAKFLKPYVCSIAIVTEGGPWLAHELSLIDAETFDMSETHASITIKGNGKGKGTGKGKGLANGARVISGMKACRDKVFWGLHKEAEGSGKGKGTGKQTEVHSFGLGDSQMRDTKVALVEDYDHVTALAYEAKSRRLVVSLMNSVLLLFEGAAKMGEMRLSWGNAESIEFVSDASQVLVAASMDLSPKSRLELVDLNTMSTLRLVDLECIAGSVRVFQNDSGKETVACLKSGGTIVALLDASTLVQTSTTVLGFMGKISHLTLSCHGLAVGSGSHVCVLKSTPLRRSKHAALPAPRYPRFTQDSEIDEVKRLAGLDYFHGNDILVVARNYGQIFIMGWDLVITRRVEPHAWVIFVAAISPSKEELPIQGSSGMHQRPCRSTSSRALR